MRKVILAGAISERDKPKQRARLSQINDKAIVEKRISCVHEIAVNNAYHDSTETSLSYLASSTAGVSPSRSASSFRSPFSLSSSSANGSS